MLIQTINVVKSYNGGATGVNVLIGLDFEMNEPGIVGIFGASGSGKSTMLHILGGLDRPDGGSVLFEGSEVYNMNERSIASFRNQSIGFVFQFYYLLPEFSAVENVMMPCLINGMSKKEASRLALKALEEVSLSHRSLSRPAEMSGGEQQRVAIARAAVMRPKLILADEPTGNLDRETGELVFDYLLKLNRENNIALIIVSHNQELLKKLPKNYLLRDGRLCDI